MKNAVTATELARNVGDILARVRYRGESFVVERNGRAVARIVPAGPSLPATVREALSEWITARNADSAFAEDLAQIDAAAYPAENVWDS